MTAAFALDTPDLDQARELVAGYIGPFALTPRRRSGNRARVRAARVGALGVADVFYNGAVDIVSAAPPRTVLLEIPTDSHCRVRQRGALRRVGRGDVVATPPEGPVCTCMEDGSRLLVLRVPVSAVDPLVERDGFSGRGWTPARVLPAARLAAVERIARLIFEEADTGGTLLGDAAVATELQQVMLALLAGGPGWRPEDTEAADRSGPVPRSVRRAQALMIAAPDGGLPLETLAGRCGVSLRTLQENFRQFTGASPSEWWRAYRLDRVHGVLGAGRPGTTVTEAATAYGFYHLGRFAEQYRNRFGQPPSETLRRAAGERAGRDG